MRTDVHRIELSTTVASREARADAGRIALIVGVTGLLADVTYVLASAVLLGDVAGPSSQASSVR